MDWRDSFAVGQMTAAITSCFLCDSLFRSYCVSVQSAADVQLILCTVIVGCSRHGSTTQTSYY